VTFLYILRCCDDALYVGTTDDLTARLERHNRGAGCAFTARRTPVTLEHSEEFATRAEAMTRERQIKGCPAFTGGADPSRSLKISSGATCERTAYASSEGGRR